MAFRNTLKSAAIRAAAAALATSTRVNRVVYSPAARRLGVGEEYETAMKAGEAAWKAYAAGEAEAEKKMEAAVEASAAFQAAWNKKIGEGLITFGEGLVEIGEELIHPSR